MTPRQYYFKHPKDLVNDVCKNANTSFGNFKQIALSGGSVGKNLAARLARASNYEMTEMEILYPERYEVKDK